MPLTNEQFYELCAKYGIDLDGDYSRDQAEMTLDVFWFTRAIERAAREAAIDECAKVAEQWGDARNPDNGGLALRNYAAAIRALREGS